MKTLLTLVLLSTFSGLVHASEVPQLQCLGTEPFWGITTDANGTLSMSDPMSDSKRDYSKATVKSAQGTTADFAFQIEATNEASNTLKLNVVKAECNDGMSENIYPYTALVDVDDRILFGCCY
ncbi:MAG: hypothetical protein H7281_14585 [Bacteriovorax sp.]|nr:hypothetical protein [Bacteriovorax sp.]